MKSKKYPRVVVDDNQETQWELLKKGIHHG